MCYLSPTPDAPSLETRRDDDDGGGDRMVFGNNFTECCLKKMPLFCTLSWHFHKWNKHVHTQADLAHINTKFMSLDICVC